MNGRLRFTVVFALILAAASAFRLGRLDRRPMHTDEAVHALKFGDLLETGTFRYDPADFHGPTLHFATLVPALVRGQRRLAALDETTLRLVPACFGIGLVALMLLFLRPLGRRAVLAAAGFTAVSPAMVFYSRYYIQETLFVFFLAGWIAFLFRYAERPGPGRAAVAGVFAGLMHATKETAVVVWAALAAAWILDRIFCRFYGARRFRSDSAPARPVRTVHVLVGAASAVAVSAAFLTSGFRNPGAFIESFAAYAGYLTRGSSLHVHPWHYYFHLLGWWKPLTGPAWTEAVIFIFGIAGLISVFVKRTDTGRSAHSGFIPFLGLYTIILTALFCAIPYKTPWNLLAFWHGWMLLAGAGAAFLLEAGRPVRIRIAAGTLLSSGILLLAAESASAIGRYDCDPRNPYVYSHPGPDVIALSTRVHAAAFASEDGAGLRIDVVVPGHGYWPLPWYFRDLSAVGWRDSADVSQSPAGVVLALSGTERDLVRWFYESQPPGRQSLYVPLLDRGMELRPGLSISGWIRNDLRERIERMR
jgi:uncharacterized protein (TIGR03663 family)